METVYFSGKMMGLEIVKLGGTRNKDKTETSPGTGWLLGKGIIPRIKTWTFQTLEIYSQGQMFFKYPVSSFIVLFIGFTAGAPKFQNCFANTVL